MERERGGDIYLIDLSPEPILEPLLCLPECLLGAEHVQVSENSHHFREPMDLWRKREGEEVREDS